MRRLRRSLLTTGVVGLGLLGAAAAPANAAALTDASGTFYYVDLLAGQSQINNPTLGNCYSTGVLSLLALSATNNTNAVATTYTDPFCTLLGARVNPGNTSNLPFGSVRFSAS
ncbi:hypothetical protein [Streptomyces atroolivaceus]|uniref:hypothetical protein n=1 Tax=Streptomyces atroolivaceus TaxID=66869 RepID=UPI00341F6097